MKMEPINNSRWCERKLSRIRDVKQHLARQHTPKRYCQACLSTDFPDDQNLQAHIQIRKCSARNPADLGEISYEQRGELSRKSNPNADKEDQWFDIWEILFPNKQRPLSVYVDNDLSLEMRQFREYCNSRGPALLSEQLETDPALLAAEVTEEQRRLYLERVIAAGVEQLFENWRLLSDRSPATSSTSNSSRPESHETLANSVVDSGVGMGNASSSSSTGTRSRRGELPQTLAVRAAEFATQSAEEPSSSHLQIAQEVQEGGIAVPPWILDQPSLPFASFDSIMEGQEGDWGGIQSGDGDENELEFHASLLDTEGMTDYFLSQLDQENVAEGQPAETLERL